MWGRDLVQFCVGGFAPSEGKGMDASGEEGKRGRGGGGGGGGGGGVVASRDVGSAMVLSA